MNNNDIEIPIEAIQHEYEHLISTLIIRIAALHAENTYLQQNQPSPDTPTQNEKEPR